MTKKLIIAEVDTHEDTMQLARGVLDVLNLPGHCMVYDGATMRDLKKLVVDEWEGPESYASNTHEDSAVPRDHATLMMESDFSTRSVLQFFRYNHLAKPVSQRISRRFQQLACWLICNLPQNPQRTGALNDLLSAKDKAVRADLDEVSPRAPVDRTGLVK